MHSGTSSSKNLVVSFALKCFAAFFAEGTKGCTPFSMRTIIDPIWPLAAHQSIGFELCHWGADEFGSKPLSMHFWIFSVSPIMQCLRMSHL